jgi:hypothetical protein
MDATSRQILYNHLRQGHYTNADVLQLTAVLRSAYGGVYGDLSHLYECESATFLAPEDLSDIEYNARRSNIEQQDLELLIAAYDSLFNSNQITELQVKKETKVEQIKKMNSYDPIRVGEELVSPNRFWQWLVSQSGDRLFKPCDYEKGFLLAFLKETWGIECSSILTNGTFITRDDHYFVIPRWFEQYDASFLQQKWFLYETGGYATAQFAVEILANMAGVEAPKLKTKAKQERETIECSHCKSSGSCNNCRGSGRADRGKTRCYVCDGTGACHICDGVGSFLA